MRVKLGELINVKTGKLDANAANENGLYPFFTCSKEPLRINTYTYDCECVLVAGNGDLNVKYYKGKFDAYQRTYILESSSNKLYMPYLYFFMDKYVDTLRKQSIGGVIKYIKLENITNASLELIDINKQKEICNKIYKVKELIDKQKKIIDHLDTLIKARFVEMFGDEKTKGIFEDYVEISRGASPRPIASYITEEDGINWIKIGDVTPNDIYIKKTEEKIKKEGADKSRYVKRGDFILSNSMSFGRPYILNIDGCVHDGWLIISHYNNNYEPIFLYYLIRSDGVQHQFRTSVEGAIVSNLNSDIVRNVKVILPDKSKQKKFVNFAEHIDKLKFE